MPPNDGNGQSFDECGEEVLIAHSIGGISLLCKVTECPLKNGHILVGELAKELDLGLQNVGVWLVLRPEETLVFIVGAFLSSSEDAVKNQSTTGEADRKEMRAGVGSQSNPFIKRGNGFEMREIVFEIGKR